MGMQAQQVRKVCGTLDNKRSFEVIDAAPHTLLVVFPEDDAPHGPIHFTELTLTIHQRTQSLGAGVYEPHPHPYRRRTDPPRPSGAGRISFVSQLYDFSGLFRDGVITNLEEKICQLGLLWSRKEEIEPQFRDYTAELVYDTQVYRALFDGIDRNLAQETDETIARIHNVTLDLAFPDFSKFFDAKLEELKQLTAHFAKQDHERHGFYFRKQVRDIIAASEFMWRTNIKPRGYAGDSEMMRMLYDRRFVGYTIFAKMMHRHPVESAAAQAVRNRRRLLKETLATLGADHDSSLGKFRLMSVACGPAWELRDLIQDTQYAQDYAYVLLDQDGGALEEARQEILEAEKRVGQKIDATFIQDSVRTMLRTPKLDAQWGRFHFIYTMGLFDYLVEPVAEAVLGKLYETLHPGGQILVGNFHEDSPTKLYMDYWMDWSLYYRSEEDLLELAENLPGAHAEVSFEQTGCQMFLRIRKGKA